MKNAGTRTLHLFLTAVFLLSVLISAHLTALAEGTEPDGTLRVSFVCDETTAAVTVYDPNGTPVPVAEDGRHHLRPGTWYYSASAEGYEDTGLQPFTVPADAAGDQALRITMTPRGEAAPAPNGGEDPDARLTEPEDDGKLRIRPVDGSLTLTIERGTKTEPAVPPEAAKLLKGREKPLQTKDGKPVEKKLWLKTPDAEELYLDRLAVEKVLGYYTTDWTVLNLTDEEGERKTLTAADGWYDVTFSGPATEQYRAFEPVFALLTLHWDAEGDIVDRDVQILETTHTPTRSSWSFSTDTLSTLVIAVPTGQPLTEETPETEAKPQTLVFRVTGEEDSIALSEILAGTGLSGEVTGIQSGNLDLFFADDSSGEWRIRFRQAFSTTERLRVVLDGREYEIGIIDGRTAAAPGKKPLIITPDSVAKVYGEEDPALTWTVEGLEDGDLLAGAPAREAGENVGSYAITQGTLSAGEKYEIVLAEAYLTITKAESAVTRAPEAITGP